VKRAGLLLVAVWLVLVLVLLPITLRRWLERRGWVRRRWHGIVVMLLMGGLATE